MNDEAKVSDTLPAPSGRRHQKLIATAVVAIILVTAGLLLAHHHKKSVTTVPGSGITGTVTGLTAKVVCPAATSNAKSVTCYQYFVSVNSLKGGSVIATVAVRQNGQFKASVPAGTYYVSLQSTDPKYPAAAPQKVTIAPYGLTKLLYNLSGPSTPAR